VRVNVLDQSAVKRVLDECTCHFFTELGYEEDATFANIKLVLGGISVLLAFAAQFYPVPYPESAYFLSVVVCVYFVVQIVLNGLPFCLDGKAILLSKPRRMQLQEDGAGEKKKKPKRNANALPGMRGYPCARLGFRRRATFHDSRSRVSSLRVLLLLSMCTNQMACLHPVYAFALYFLVLPRNIVWSYRTAAVCALQCRCPAMTSSKLPSTLTEYAGKMRAKKQLRRRRASRSVQPRSLQLLPQRQRLRRRRALSHLRPRQRAPTPTLMRAIRPQRKSWTHSLPRSPLSLLSVSALFPFPASASAQIA
jgi:hypothetical protein